MSAEDDSEVNGAKCECDKREQLEQLVLGSKALHLLLATVVSFVTILTQLSAIQGSL